MKIKDKEGNQARKCVIFIGRAKLQKVQSFLEAKLNKTQLSSTWLPVDFLKAKDTGLMRRLVCVWWSRGMAKHLHYNLSYNCWLYS